MNPTSPSRRAHILQAHALRARGYTIAQIAELTNHAPSTVHAWLKDLEAKRQYFISAFAQDQLLVLLHDEAELLRHHQLNPPKDAEEATSRNQQMQTYTALARELRMVCAQLSRTALAVYGGPEDEHLTPDEVDAITHATTLREQLSDRLQPSPPPDNSEQSEATQTDLEISEFPETESPVEDSKSANSAPEKSSSEFEPIEELVPFLDPDDPIVKAARYNPDIRALLEKYGRLYRDEQQAIPIQNERPPIRT